MPPARLCCSILAVGLLMSGWSSTASAYHGRHRTKPPPKLYTPGQIGARMASIVAGPQFGPTAEVQVSFTRNFNNRHPEVIVNDCRVTPQPLVGQFIYARDVMVPFACPDRRLIAWLPIPNAPAYHATYQSSYLRAMRRACLDVRTAFNRVHSRRHHTSMNCWSDLMAVDSLVKINGQPVYDQTVPKIVLTFFCNGSHSKRHLYKAGWLVNGMTFFRSCAARRGMH